MDEQTKKKITMTMIISSIGCMPLFLMIFTVFVVVLFVLGLFEGGSSSSGGNLVSSNNGECGFTISQTSLSKTEFKNLIQEYASQPGNSHWQIFADYADDYYDYAKAKGVNPELIVTVAGKENGGHETTPGTNNYWGWGCPNGAAACEGLDNFMIGAKNVIDSASKYDTIYNWFYVGHYSWIGDYWYNPGNSGDGGCYYAKYIYPDNMPTRVKNACAAGNECSGSNCQKTVPEEDQAAYSNYLIKVMLSFRRDIFKLADNEGVSCTGSSSANGFIESYVTWMIKTSEDDSVGYSKTTRYLNPNVDCSSFVWYGLVRGAGVDEDKLGGTPFATDSMEYALTGIGFKKHNYTSEKDLQRGDILWVHNNNHQHTEVYVGDEKNVGAHWDKDSKNGDSSGEEVNVSGGYNDTYGWAAYFRYEGSEN